MNNLLAPIFAPIYENFLFQGKYDLIFFSLFDHGGYMYFGLTFIVVAIIFTALFYWVPKFPYLKWWHWVLWMLLGSIIVAGITFSIASGQIFNSPDPNLQNALNTASSGFRDFANSLIFQLSFLNAVYAFIASFILSIIFKRLSKLRMHLPF
jgi:hypothetical protein